MEEIVKHEGGFRELRQFVSIGVGFESLSKTLFIDGSNVEIVTSPVFLNELERAIADSYLELQKFISRLFKEGGSVACFLSRSVINKARPVVSKHVTERDMRIVHSRDHRKFREVRVRAKQEEKERYYADKRYKKNKEVVYFIYPVGKEIVFIMHHNPRMYGLGEIIDIFISEWPPAKYTRVDYFAVVRKVSNERFIRCVGHLIKIEAYCIGGRSISSYTEGEIFDCDSSKIKWFDIAEYNFKKSM